MNKHEPTELCSYELRDDIAFIGLNRPEKRNAISDRFVEAIAAAATRAEKEAKAVVLYGHGKHFCAGLDLAEHSEKSLIEGVAGSRRWHAVFDMIEHGGELRFSQAVAQSEETERSIPCHGRCVSQEIALHMGYGARRCPLRLTGAPGLKR